MPPQLELLAQPFGGRGLGDVLVAELRQGAWSNFRATVAFLKHSGFRQLAPPLGAFLRQAGTTATISVGIDHDGTSLEALQDLWRAMTGRGDLFVFTEGQGGSQRTFHPKGYLFERPGRALALIGSGNLTAGGLFTNHELTVSIGLDLREPDCAAFHAQLTAALARWQQPGPACRLVDPVLLRDLVAGGHLLSEAAIVAGARHARASTRSAAAARSAGRPTSFGSSGAIATTPPAGPLPPMVAAPVPLPARQPARPITPSPSSSPGQATAPHQTFVIEVRPHHNGEVFLSKRAVIDDPGFFGAPFSGSGTTKQAHTQHYPHAEPKPQVLIVVHDASGSPLMQLAHDLTLVEYERKSDIRITIPPAPLTHIPAMSLLAMTRYPSSRYDYRLDFYPPTCATPQVQALRAKLTTTLPSGGIKPPRRYGWA